MFISIQTHILPSFPYQEDQEGQEEREKKGEWAQGDYITGLALVRNRLLSASADGSLVVWGR
jgi:hypothetical protein